MNPLRKFCNWYFSRGTLPYWCILAMDCAAVFLSGLAIDYLKYGGLSLAQHFWQLTLGLGICLLAYVVAFFAFHTFRGVMRYSGFVDLSRIAYSNIAACVFVCLVKTHRFQPISLKNYVKNGSGDDFSWWFVRKCVILQAEKFTNM